MLLIFLFKPQSYEIYNNLCCMIFQAETLTYVWIWTSWSSHLRSCCHGDALSALGCFIWWTLSLCAHWIRLCSSLMSSTWSPWWLRWAWLSLFLSRPLEYRAVWFCMWSQRLLWGADQLLTYPFCRVLNFVWHSQKNCWLHLDVNAHHYNHEFMSCNNILILELMDFFQLGTLADSGCNHLNESVSN